MTRLALVLVVAAAGVTTVVHRRHDHLTSPTSASAPASWLLRTSRAQERQPLPGVHARMTGEGVTPQLRRAPVRRGPSRPAPGSGLLDITAYCATGHRTASGQWPRIGMAAGNRWLFGTVLHIDGYGDVTIEDRIGWGSDVDVFFGDDAGCEARASAFGRQHRRVAVVQ